MITISPNGWIKICAIPNFPGKSTTSQVISSGSWHHTQVGRLTPTTLGTSWVIFRTRTGLPIYNTSNHSRIKPTPIHDTISAIHHRTSSTNSFFFRGLLQLILHMNIIQTPNRAHELASMKPIRAIPTQVNDSEAHDSFEWFKQNHQWQTRPVRIFAQVSAQFAGLD